MLNTTRTSFKELVRNENLTFRRLTSTIVDVRRPANLQSYILYIYSTNIGTEYFKHGVYSPIFLFKM